MNQNVWILPKLKTLLFQLSSAERRQYPAEWISDARSEERRHTLIFTAGGSFSLYVNDRLIPAAERSCYMLAPGNSWYISNLSMTNVELICIYFSIVRTNEHGSDLFGDQLLPIDHAWHMYAHDRCSRLVNGIGTASDEAGEVEGFKRNLLFQELMGALLESNWPDRKEMGDMFAVEATARYLESHYAEPITVRQLAEQAQLPAWQYSSMFQTLTGKKPLAYLNQVRIDRSKEWLLGARMPLREVACKVGFADEYYYSRRFRQLTGMIPREYARSVRQRREVQDWTGHRVQIPLQPKRILYYGETVGDFLALGVRPVGANVRLLHNSWMQEAVREIEDIGIPLNPRKAASLEPDLIIFSSSDERQYEQLAKIAPTLTYDTFAPLEQRLQHLGEWLGKQSEASLWMAEYSSRLTVMRQQMKEQIRPGETATVFLYHRGRRLFVMGTSGLAGLLYYPSGFGARDAVRQMLDAGEPYREIGEADLPLYAGDRLFVLMPDMRPSNQATRELMRSKGWNQLSAVQKGKVHVLEEAKWNLVDACTRERQIRLLPGLLGEAASR